MPSPFPGMDPFIESQIWEDFHTRAITVLAEQLAPRLDRRYTARVERRIYIDHAPPTESVRGEPHIVADAALVQETESAAARMAATDSPAATLIECLLPEPEQRREAFLVIRDELGEFDVITVVELLSPSNKRRGSDGRRNYLRKREEIINSGTHPVEIDLLRAGDRMPMRVQASLIEEYVALISRSFRRPKAELVTWPLRRKLPEIPIPLVQGQADVVLDLQSVLDTVYDRAFYDRMLKYTAPLHPPADEATQRWIAEQLNSQ